MRIGLVVPGFSADARDWCIPALRHLARSLAARDDVRVIALRYPYRAARYPIDGAETIALGGALRHRAATLALWRTALDLLRTEHRQRPFDVLHAFWATESGLLAALAGRLLHVPTLVSLAGGELVAMRDIQYGDQRLAWERAKVAASLRLANGVSAGSRQLVARADARRRAGPRRPGQPTHLAPLGVDLDLFRPAPYHTTRHKTRHAPRLVHVGALTPVKDQGMLLRALARVRTLGGVPASLEVVGSGPLRPCLERLVGDLGLEGDVLFQGECDHADLPGVYRAADALVMSSRHEAQCMVALEAAACGVPVIGTRVGVLPELTAAVAPVGDAPSLARVIAGALGDDADTARAATLDYTRATFGLGASVDRFRQIYAALIAT